MGSSFITSAWIRGHWSCSFPSCLLDVCHSPVLSLLPLSCLIHLFDWFRDLDLWLPMDFLSSVNKQMEAKIVSSISEKGGTIQTHSMVSRYLVPTDFPNLFLNTLFISQYKQKHSISYSLLPTSPNKLYVLGLLTWYVNNILVYTISIERREEKERIQGLEFSFLSNANWKVIFCL